MTALSLPIDVETIKGFMDPVEGAALHDRAAEMCGRGPVVEIGTYCGKSAVYIGTACKANGGHLFAIDHHRGSEENQPGWEHHDADTWDDEAGAMDTLPFLRTVLRRAELEDHVISMVGRSTVIASYWTTPIAMLFIDGGHSFEMASGDYNAWAPKVMPGGILAIHDIFPDPKDGGQAPFQIYQMALASGLYEELPMVKTLGLLRRVEG